MNVRPLSDRSYRGWSSNGLPTVLVVDDEPQVVWVLEFSLQGEGYETLTAHDGFEAMDQIDAITPT